METVWFTLVLAQDRETKRQLERNAQRTGRGLDVVFAVTQVFSVISWLLVVSLTFDRWSSNL
jgi:hypothetical protein